MISSEEYLKSLNEKSVWVFTKQKTSDFDEIIKVANFFDNIPNKEETNIEQYFAEHHEEYGIETDRHRTLVIPQLFGFITKTPFYKRGGTYNKEKVTAVYDELKKTNSELNKDRYNKILTEQVLKIKIHAIIDTENNNNDYHILPIIYIYMVLKTLQQKYDINEITLDQLYTYVMTCKDYSQLEQSVEYIRSGAPASKYVERYKDLSRIITLVRNTINLFNVNARTISINPVFDDYFYNKFISKFDIEEMNEVLYRDADYSYFLYYLQDFDVNLIDSPKEIQDYIYEEPEKVHKEVIKNETDENEIDDNYIEKIDQIDENNVNPDVAEGAYKIPPQAIESEKISKKYKRNPLLGRVAIEKAYYCCECNPHHETFTSAKTRKPFMEAHHLIPIKYQMEMYKKYHINIDCVENIGSLCPTCHRAFHNGTKEVKQKMIDTLYDKLYPRYKSIGLEITKEEIYKLYGVK